MINLDGEISPGHAPSDGCCRFRMVCGHHTDRVEVSVAAVAPRHGDGVVFN